MQAVVGDVMAAGEREGPPDRCFGDPAEVADSPQLVDQSAWVQQPADRGCPVNRPLVGGCERPGGGEIVIVGELDGWSLGWVAAAHDRWFALHSGTPAGARCEWSRTGGMWSRTRGGTTNTGV